MKLYFIIISILLSSICMAKEKFNWKALWAHKVKSEKDAAELVVLTQKMNCNILIVHATSEGLIAKEKSAIKTVINSAHKKGIKVYYWMVNLRVPSEFSRKHPELMQKVKPDEQKKIGSPRINPERANVHGGNWLNPDFGLTDYEKNIIQKMLTEFNFDGLALDYVGYRNYYACFSDYSNKKRKEFANQHPQMTKQQILEKFSENSLINYTFQARKAAKAVKKDIKLAIHIYPDFDPNPTYGSKLPIEYSGQTIAWFYKPFWSLKKVRAKCMMYKNAKKQKYKYNKFVPFIGVYSGKRLKSPERLRQEIRIAELAGNGTVMLAFAKTFAKHTELVKIVAEEFSKTKEN